MNLTDFLLARIAEDEEDICHCCDQGLGSRMGFARAECEAKRRIVDDHEWDEVSGRTRVLRFLALPYADHPDYHEEWKP